MTRVLDRLSEKHEIDAEDRVAARAAALLHDVGHGSFSHVMEKVLNFHHERWTVRVILESILRLDNNCDLIHPTSLKKSLRSSKESFNRQRSHNLCLHNSTSIKWIILRDSLMTGAKYGIYDLEWIINALAIDETADRVYVQRVDSTQSRNTCKRVTTCFVRSISPHASLRRGRVAIDHAARVVLARRRSGGLACSRDCI